MRIMNKDVLGYQTSTSAVTESGLVLDTHMFLTLSARREDPQYCLSDRRSEGYGIAYICPPLLGSYLRCADDMACIAYPPCPPTPVTTHDVARSLRLYQSWRV